jgi:hypothetical protein
MLLPVCALTRFEFDSREEIEKTDETSNIAKRRATLFLNCVEFCPQE